MFINTLWDNDLQSSSCIARAGHNLQMYFSTMFANWSIKNIISVYKINK
jgi:hypothetical protein